MLRDELQGLLSQLNELAVKAGSDATELHQLIADMQALYDNSEATMSDLTAAIENLKAVMPELEWEYSGKVTMRYVRGATKCFVRVDVEGIFLNRDGQVAEGIVSNIFWVKDGVVYTPAPSVGILNGVTRQFVIALLERLHIPIKEGAYPLSHLQEADEVFITNSLQEIVPLHCIGRRSYSGKHGPVTCALQHHYRRFTDTLWTRNELKERMNE